MRDLVKLLSVRKINTWLIFLLIGVLIPYICLAFYSHPFADDFEFSKIGQLKGFIHGNIHFYLNIPGRYTSNMLLLFNPLVYNSFRGYQLVGILLILLTLIANCWFLSAIFSRQIKRGQILMIGLIITCLYIYQMPSVSQGFYWYTGSITYQLGAIIALMQVATVIDFIDNRLYLNKKFHLTLSLLMLIIAMGFNEVLMLLIIGFYTCLSIRSFQLKKANRHLWLCFLIIASLCFLVDLLAPGTAKRDNFYAENHQFFHSFLYTLMQCGRFFLKWVLTIPFIILSILFIPLSRYLSLKLDLFRNNFYMRPVIWSLFLFADLFLCIFPPYWSTGILGQYRTVNTAYFFFIMLWFFTLHAWINYFGPKKAVAGLRISRRVYALCMFLVISSFAFTKNGFYATKDLLSGKAAAFDIEMKERYTILRKAASEKKERCYLKPISNWPPSLFFLDITSDQEHWQNKVYGIYFNVPEIYLDKTN